MLTLPLEDSALGGNSRASLEAALDISGVDTNSLGCVRFVVADIYVKRVERCRTRVVRGEEGAEEKDRKLPYIQ
jgi:hypothetical protein